MTKKVVSGKEIHKALHGSKITATAIRHSMKVAIDALETFAKRVTVDNSAEFEVTVEQNKPVAPIKSENAFGHGQHMQTGPEKIIVTFVDSSGVGRIRGAT